MPRPSKTEERREQILDAFETVILRDGYAKASQRRIAQEAELNQPMIHHYFKGGESLLDALLERVVNRYLNALNAFNEARDQITLEDIIEFVCSDAFHQVSKQNEMFFCLIGQSCHEDHVVKKMSDVYQVFLSQIEHYLKEANIKNADKISYFMMCLIIGHDWAKKLGLNQDGLSNKETSNSQPSKNESMAKLLMMTANHADEFD
jgi:AcrR family transcriptional regulator